MIHKQTARLQIIFDYQIQFRDVFLQAPTTGKHCFLALRTGLSHYQLDDQGYIFELICSGFKNAIS